jgi:chorismate mutase/prephenate dehydratase
MTPPSAQGGLEAISRVLSHPKALEQCSLFLERHPHILPVVCSDTAGAALQVNNENDPHSAAIASDEAAREYGLTVIAPAIQNHTSNMTRFFAIATESSDSPSATKCSLILSLPHQPASLYKLLGEFAALSINITKIESRPISGKPFEYSFHLDIEKTPQSTGTLEQAVERAQKASADMRVLGFYSTTAR